MVKQTFDQIKEKLPLRGLANFVGYSGVWSFNCQGIDINFVCNDYIGATMYIQDILSRKELEYLAISKVGDKSFNFFWTK